MSFASDNWAGAHPDVLAAVAAANEGPARAYGDDPWTERARELIRERFGPHARAYPVFNGTAANVLSIEAVTRRWEAVLCPETAHLNVDEAGAPERTGRKLLPVATSDGRVTPDLLEPLLARAGDEHAVQPRVVSISQSTELGTVYTRQATVALAEWAHAHGLLLHVDGARLANAAAGAKVPLRALTTDAGVDVLSFGGTKNGALGVEAVVFLSEELGDGFKFLRKQAMQLASKMRFLSAQLVALLEADLWRRNAEHANGMAARLAGAVRQIPGVRITRPVEANGVFATLPPGAADALIERWPFHVWDERSGEVRWMCAWNTDPADVDEFAAAVHDACAARA